MATNSNSSGWTVPKWVWEVLGKSLDMLFYLAVLALLIGFLVRPLRESAMFVAIPLMLAPIFGGIYIAYIRWQS